MLSTSAESTHLIRLSLADQEAFCRLQEELEQLKAKHTAIREANAALIPATLERLFAEHG
jgi:hypothetical protein